MPIVCLWFGLGSRLLTTKKAAVYLRIKYGKKMKNKDKKEIKEM